MTDSVKPINSPCISICALDEEDVCVGCHRTVDEIRGWMAMDNDERQAVLKQSHERAKKSNPFI